MRFIKVLLLVVVFFLSMVFFQQNNVELSQTVTLQFDLLFRSWTSIPLPIYFLILSSFLLGAVLAIALTCVKNISLRNDLRRSRKQIKKLEKEVNSLRTMAIEEAPTADVGSIASDHTA